MFYLSWENKDYFGQSPLGWVLPLTLGASQAAPAWWNPPSTAGSSGSVCSPSLLCSSRAMGVLTPYSFQLFHHAEDIIKILMKKNIGRKVA